MLIKTAYGVDPYSGMPDYTVKGHKKQKKTLSNTSNSRTNEVHTIPGAPKVPTEDKVNKVIKDVHKQYLKNKLLAGAGIVGGLVSLGLLYAHNKRKNNAN